jgi:hypothetical protein
LIVDFLRGANLLNPGPVHHDHTIGHLQGLVLVVGDKDAGHSQLGVEHAQPPAQFDTNPGVESPERFIEQEHFGVGCQGPGQGHSLALAAAELVRVTLIEAFKLHEFKQAEDFVPHGFLGLLARAHMEAKCDVLKNVHVPEKRVVLEHKPHLAFPHGNARGIFSVQQHMARVGVFQSGDNPQKCGFAGTRGA